MEMVENNWGDICSYTPMLVAIEMIPANHLYWTGEPEVYWYKWTWAEGQEANEGSYKPIEIPPGLEDKVLHSIG